MPASLQVTSFLLASASSILFPPSRWCQDFMNGSVHGETNPLVCLEGGAVPLGYMDELVGKHTERQICLCPGCPGQLPVMVDGSIFEMWGWAGQVFIGIYHLKDALMPKGSESLVWKW